MAEKAKKAKLMKDLDPKGDGQHVKGGICCLACCVLSAADRAAGRAQRDVRKALNPR
ncbi:MAG TPA: hypothetical protein VFA34_01020 [Actinomycetota bacterium]|jgi:hypothetical protein|nr:hypothetical protein [Actinomycetota bacterium]